MGMICIYDTGTGQIVRNITCTAAEEELQAGDGEGMIPGNHFDPTLYYVSSGVVSDRPIDAGIVCSHQTITANGIDEAVVSGLPNPSVVVVADASSEGGQYAVTDGQLELTFDTAGVYTITVHPPFPTQFVVLSLEAV